MRLDKVSKNYVIESRSTAEKGTKKTSAFKQNLKVKKLKSPHKANGESVPFLALFFLN